MLTDCLPVWCTVVSVLEATAGYKLFHLTESLHEVVQHRQGSPAVGTSPLRSSRRWKSGELATLGAKGRQQDNSVTFQEKMILISETLGQCTERDDSTSSTSHSRLLDYAWATTDSTPTCTCRKMKFGTITNLQQWSWRPLDCWTHIYIYIKYCWDACFYSQQEQNVRPTAAQLHIKQFSMVAGRNWKRWPHSSCRLDSQCSGNQEEEDDLSQFVG